MQKQIQNMLANGLRKQISEFTFYIPVNRIVIENDLYPTLKHPDFNAILSSVQCTMGSKEKLSMLHGVYGHFSTWGSFTRRMSKHLKGSILMMPELIITDKVKITFEVEEDYEELFGTDKLIYEEKPDDLSLYAKHFPDFIKKPEKSKRKK